MSSCQGNITVSTKVDARTRQFIEDEEEKLGVTPSEFLRRVIELYKGSQEGALVCPCCGEELNLRV